MLEPLFQEFDFSQFLFSEDEIKNSQVFVYDEKKKTRFCLASVFGQFVYFSPQAEPKINRKKGISLHLRKFPQDEKILHLKPQNIQIDKENGFLRGTIEDKLIKAYQQPKPIKEINEENLIAYLPDKKVFYVYNPFNNKFTELKPKVFASLRNSNSHGLIGCGLEKELFGGTLFLKDKKGYFPMGIITGSFVYEDEETKPNVQFTSEPFGYNFDFKNSEMGWL